MISRLKCNSCRNNPNNVIQRLYWVDMVKAIAIIFVLIDHTSGLLEWNNKLTIVSFCAVELFVLMMGITTYNSLLNRNERVSRYLAKRMIKIVVPYVVACLCIQVYNSRIFDLESYILGVFRFDISPQFYYIALYLQLLIISPLLFCMLRNLNSRKCAHLLKILLGFIMLFAVYIFMNRTNVMNIYGGGGKVFGGNYLLVFYIGMLLAEGQYSHIANKCVLSICTIIAAVITIVWWNFLGFNRFDIDSKIPFGNGISIGSISSIINAISIAILVLLVERCLEVFNFRFGILVYRMVSKLGQHTLYIFLYHLLFLNIIVRMKCQEMSGNVCQERIFVLVGIVILPMLWEIIIKRILLYISEVYKS